MEILKKMLRLSFTTEVEYRRFGSKHDGGYVLVNDLSKNDFIVSCGIETNVDWEMDISTLVWGINAYDNSIDELPKKIDNCVFYKKTISKDVFVSDLVKDADKNKDLILKVDVEGAEWGLFNDFPDLSRFRQIIGEFHGLVHAIEDDIFFNIVCGSLSNLNKTHFPVFIHGNNYGGGKDFFGSHIVDVVEILYLRKTDYVHFYGKMNFDRLLSTNCPCGCPKEEMKFVDITHEK